MEISLAEGVQIGILLILFLSGVVAYWQMTRTFRPRIYTYIYSLDNKLWLIIKNIGNRSAYNIKINFTPSLENISLSKDHYEPVLEQSFLPPNEEIIVMLHNKMDTVSLVEGIEENVEIKYNKKHKKHKYFLWFRRGVNYKETYKIKFDNYIYSKKLKMYSEGFEINENLSAINKSLTEIINIKK